MTSKGSPKKPQERSLHVSQFIPVSFKSIYLYFREKLTKVWGGGGWWWLRKGRVWNWWKFNVLRWDLNDLLFYRKKPLHFSNYFCQKVGFCIPFWSLKFRIGKKIKILTKLVNLVSLCDNNYLYNLMEL